MSWIKEHKLIILSMVFIAIFLGVLGVILVDMIDQKAVSTTKIQSKEEETIKGAGNSEAEQVEKVSDNPFGSQNAMLAEDEILTYMHGMSHQKVIADEKWVHYQITNERIQFLISVIETGSYENSDLLLEILNRWKEADFTKADKEHNAIWRLQGGTIGKATGVMSPEEEKEYIEKNKGSIK